MFGFSSDTPTSAIEVLKNDHDEVEKLFDQYEDAKDESNTELKAQIVATVCKALTSHAQIEEELFYPAVRRDLDDAADLLDEAKVEHQTLKALVAELEGAAPDEALYDAKVKVLSEYVKHHVREEEGELFPLARRSEIDLETLGRDLLARKEALAANPVEGMVRRRSRSTSTSSKPAPARARNGGKGATTRKVSAQGRH